MVLELISFGDSMLALFEDPFEQPLVISRNTPDITVTANKPAPKIVFSLEKTYLLVLAKFFFEGSLPESLPK